MDRDPIVEKPKTGTLSSMYMEGGFQRQKSRVIDFTENTTNMVYFIQIHKLLI